MSITSINTMEDRKLQTATSSPPTVPSQSPSQLTSTPSPTQSASTPSPTSSTTATTPAPTQSQAAPTDAPSSGATSAPSAPPTSSIAPTAPIPQEELINWEYENVVALRWNIQNPPQVTYNGLTFDLIFTVSDYVEPDDHVRYELYEGPTCGDETKLMADDGHIETEVAGDNTPVGGGIMTREVTVSSTLNPQTISKSGAYQEESASDASITFCVQFSLWSGPTSDTEATMVNSVDATVALSVDLTDDFSISGQQLEAREQDVKTSDDKFFVEAFLCDGNGDSLQDILPFVQGQALRICVKPTQQAYDVGFRMKRVDKFRFEQGYTTQEAIINEDVAANGLTQLYCYPGADQSQQVSYKGTG
ncbi:MAG: hypothetical protein SGILL_000079 [Bacillariaceae sp.]